VLGVGRAYLPALFSSSMPACLPACLPILPLLSYTHTHTHTHVFHSCQAVVEILTFRTPTNLRVLHFFNNMSGTPVPLSTTYSECLCYLCYPDAVSHPNPLHQNHHHHHPSPLSPHHSLTHTTSHTHPTTTPTTPSLPPSLQSTPPHHHTTPHHTNPGDGGAEALASLMEHAPLLEDLRFSGTRAGPKGSLVSEGGSWLVGE
jgi:hypothetical protein